MGIETEYNTIIRNTNCAIFIYSYPQMLRISRAPVLGSILFRFTPQRTQTKIPHGTQNKFPAAAIFRS